MSGGGGSGSSNTVTTTQAVPQYIQQESAANQQLANSLATQNYPVYGGNIIQPFTGAQQAGTEAMQNNAYNYAPWLGAAYNTAAGVNNQAAQPFINAAAGQGAAENNVLNAGVGSTTGGLNSLGAAQGEVAAGTNYLPLAGNAYVGAQGLTNPNAVASYMSPYIQASLAPQLSDIGFQNAAQQQQINQQATQAGAFGDARQGSAQALQNYFTNQAVNQLTGSAYQNAFSAANQALGQAQQTQLGVGTGLGNVAGQYGNLANVYNQNAAQYGNITNALTNLASGYGNVGNLYNQLGTQALNQQNLGLNQAQQLAALSQQNQSQGLAGANAIYQSGVYQQNQLQNELNAAYQQFQNQVNWPYQMLNVREAGISNNPYNIQSAVTLPNANTTASSASSLGSLASLLAANTSGGPNIPR